MKEASLLHRKQGNALTNFFQDQLPDLLFSSVRNEAVAVVLIIVNQIQLFSLILTEPYEQANFIKQSQPLFLEWFKAFQITNVQGLIELILNQNDNTFQDNEIFANFSILAFQSSIHTLMLTLFVLRTTVSHSRVLVIVFINKVTSIISSVYIHLLLIPFLNANYWLVLNNGIGSLSTGVTILNYINLCITHLIALIIAYFDFDYKFVQDDHLGRRDSQFFQVIILVDSLLVLLHNTSIKFENIILHAIVSGCSFMYLVFTLPYYNNQVQMASLACNLVHCIWAITLYFFLNAIEDASIIIPLDVTLILLFIVPLAIRCTVLIFQSRVQFQPLCYIRIQINKTDNQGKEARSRSFEDLDLIIRQLTKYCNLTNQYNFLNQVNIEFPAQLQRFLTLSIQVDHQDQCTNPTCFCKEEEILNNREHFLKIFIAKLFKDYISNVPRHQQRNQILLLHLAFLIQAFPTPQKACIELGRVSEYNNQELFSLKERCAFSQLQKLCQKKHQLFFSNHSTIQNQRLKINMVLDFENRLNCFVVDVSALMIELYAFYLFLSQDSLHIFELNIKGQQLLKHRLILKQSLKDLYDMNPDSSDLHQVSEIFLTYFDIEMGAFQRYIARKQLQSSRLDVSAIDLFSKNSCSVQISLNSPAVGKIRQITESVQHIFNQEKLKCLGQNIGMLMPDFIRNKHDMFLNIFIENGKLNKIAMGEVLSFGQSQEGFVIPLQLRVKLDFFSNEGEFGSCGHMHSLCNSKDYILLSQDLTLQGITKSLFISCFKRTLHQDLNEFRLLDFRKICPYFGIMSLKQLLEKEMQYKTTLLMYPYGEAHVQELQKKLDKPELLPSFVNSQLFMSLGVVEAKIAIKVVQSDSAHFKFFFLEVEQFRKIRAKQEKYELINQLKCDINKAFNISPISNISNVLIQPRYSVSQHQFKIAKAAIHNQEPKNLENNLDIPIQGQEDSCLIIQSPIIIDSGQKKQNRLINSKEVLQKEINSMDINSQQQILQAADSQMASYSVLQNEQENQILASNQNKINVSQEIIQRQSMIHFDVNQDQSLKNISNAHPVGPSQEKIRSFQKQKDNQMQDRQISDEDYDDDAEDQDQENEKTFGIVKFNAQQSKKQSQEYNLNKLMTDNNSMISKVGKNNDIQSSDEWSLKVQGAAGAIAGAGANAGARSRGQNGIRKLISPVNKGSQGSSQQSGQSLKQNIIESITNKQQPLFIKGFNIIGLLALSVLIMSNMVVYLVIEQNFDLNSNNLNNLILVPQFQERLAGVLMNKEFIRITLMDVSGDGHPPWNITDQSISEAVNQQQLFLEMNLKNLKQVIVETTYDFTGHIWQELSPVIDVEIVQENGNTEMRHYSKNYMQILVLCYANRYSQQQDSISVRRFIQNNFATIMSYSQQLIDATVAEINEQSSSIKLLIIITLCIIESIGFLISVTLFPIYSSIQLRRQKILQLLGTFSQEKLNLMIDSLENSIIHIISSNKAMQTHFKPLQCTHSKRQKKKIISQTSQLSKFSKYILFGAVSCLLITSLYPVINLVITNQNLDEQSLNIQEITILFEAKSLLFRQFATHYLNIRRQLIGIYLTPEQIEQFKEIEDAIENLQIKLMYMDQHFLQTRSNAQEYMNYLKNILKGNICEEIFTKEGYCLNLPNQAQFDYYQKMCTAFTGGLLKKGLVVTIELIKSKLNELYQIYLKNDDIQVFAKDLRQFDTDYSIYEQNQVLKLIAASIQLVKDFLVEISNKSRQQTKYMQTTLFLISLVILSICFTSGWVKLMTFLTNYLNDTKLILSIIPVDCLLENTYIFHFIKSKFNFNRQSD